jgi:hypothetical protein
VVQQEVERRELLCGLNHAVTKSRSYKTESTIQHKLVHSNGSVHPKFPYGWKYNPALFLPYVSNVVQQEVERRELLCGLNHAVTKSRSYKTEEIG